MTLISSNYTTHVFFFWGIIRGKINKNNNNLNKILNLLQLLLVDWIYDIDFKNFLLINFGILLVIY